MSPRTSICIVWPAHFEGSTDTGSHVTALYIGKTDGKFAQSHPNLKERLEKFLSGMIQDPGPIGVDRLEGLGNNKDVPALMLGFQHELADQYQFMAKELITHGVPIDRTYPFHPHVTVSKQTFLPVYDLPKSVHLEAPVLWWGTQRQGHSRHTKQYANALKGELA